MYPFEAQLPKHLPTAPGLLACFQLGTNWCGILVWYAGPFGVKLTTYVLGGQASGVNTHMCDKSGASTQPLATRRSPVNPWLYGMKRQPAKCEEQETLNYTQGIAR
eukprot:TRINITY_DN67633_c2_g1_i2.p3 TRINITY_DN67633_c2_g1~~TRINITY_DN67633_c2_g1_i2.p3  ORF type:complete len:106 (+),score=6.63 TRINITY_DN67633_c2_g1_i2:374-691(+)